MNKLIILALAISVLTFSNCEKVFDGCNQRSYKLQANLTFTPLQESYVVGDTIGMHLEFPEAILDMNSNDTLQLTNLNIPHRWWIIELENLPESRSDALKYITVLPNGTTTGDYEIVRNGQSSYVNGNFQKLENNSYVINYKFTLDSTGYYRFDLSPFTREAADLSETSISVINECRNARFEIYYNLNGYQDENILLTCEAFPSARNCNRDLSDQEFIDLFGEAYREGGSYIFKVE